MGRLLLSQTGSITIVKTPLNPLMLILVCLILFQIVPLPPWLVNMLSPKLYVDRLLFWEVLHEQTNTSSTPMEWITIAYYLHPTFLELTKLASYFGMFFLVLNTIRSKRQIDVLIYALVLIGLFEALYAIYQVFTDAPMVWWWQSRVGQSRYAGGTFIVSNHFAAYMQMMVCLLFGFLIAQEKKSRQMISKLGGSRESFQRIVSWFSPESSRPKTLFFFFVGIVMAVALIMSASRGGIISISISLLFMSVLFLFKKRFRKYTLLTVLFCLLAIFYAMHLGIDPTLNKFEQTGGLAKRMLTSQSMLPMLGVYPITGVGWGNFRYLYPRYVPIEFDGVSSSGYSHNDWLEAGTEIGMPGLLLLYALFLFYVIKVIRIGKMRNNRHALGIGAGVLAGLISISFHSYFDFNMHIPANPLTLAALLAIGYAALNRQGHGYSESFFYRKRTFQLSRSLGMVAATTILVIVAALCYRTWSHAAAEAACPTEWNSTLNLNWEPELADIDRAIARNFGNAEYHFQRALNMVRQKADTGQDRQKKIDQAIQSLRQAAYLNPAKATYWFELGRLYAQSRPDFYDFVNVWLPRADACYTMAVHCAPKEPGILFFIADYWVWRSRLLSEKDSPVLRGSGERFRQDGIRMFQDLYKQYLRIKPGDWKRAFDSVWEVYPQDRVVYGMVPTDNDELQSFFLRELARRNTEDRN